MDRLADWIEIPANDTKLATAFYRAVLEVDFHEMEMEWNRYTLFGVTDINFGGAVVEGETYAPSEKDVVVCLNGGPGLWVVLARVEKAGAKVRLGKTFLSEQGGHIVCFKGTEPKRSASTAWAEGAAVTVGLYRGERPARVHGLPSGPSGQIALDHLARTPQRRG